MMLGLCSATPALAQSPFCVVSGLGTQCNFSDVNYCRQVAQQSNGMCVANQQLQQIPQQLIQPPAQRPATQPIYPDIAGSMIRTYQAERQQTQRSRQETNDGYWVLYKCPAPGGGMAYSGEPAVGCVVESVTKY